MGIKISELTSGSSVNGDDQYPAVQGSSTRKFSPSQMASYVLNTFSSLSLGGVARTVKSAIDAVSTLLGDSTMGTTATTVTGAIAEHESDISGLNSNLGGMFKTVNYDQSVGSTAANQIITTNINIAQTGYTPIGVLKIQNNHGTAISTRGWAVTNNTMTVYSYSTTAFSDTRILVSVAYVKSMFMA